MSWNSGKRNENEWHNHAALKRGSLSKLQRFTDLHKNSKKYIISEYVIKYNYGIYYRSKSF